jgi:hypothetical protein
VRISELYESYDAASIMCTGTLCVLPSYDAASNICQALEDGLPVFKSYDNFSDMACGQIAPKDGPAGKCPFECWCCY